MSAQFLIKFFGILLGVLARSVLPWLRKLKNGTAAKFSRRYLYSSLASLIIGIILTLVIFPRFEAESGGTSFEPLFKLFCLAFGFGFGWTALVLEGGAWAGAFGPGRPEDNPSTPDDHEMD